MSMTRADAKNYIARVLSAVQSQQAQIWAEESIQRAFTDWQIAKNWEFLLKDNTEKVAVGQFFWVANGSRLYPTLDSQWGNFYPGQKIYGNLLGTGNLNTVATAVYKDNGFIDYLTLSNSTNFTETNYTTTLSIVPEIKIIPGQTDYFLPPDFYAPATVRTLGDLGKKIEYIRNGAYYKAVATPDNAGIVDYYSFHNLQNDGSFTSTGPTEVHQLTKLRLRKPPTNSGEIRIEYFRTFNRDSDPLDIPDDYLYKFLDYCRGLILETKHASENPAAYMQHAMSSLPSAARADAEPVDDEEIRLISQMEIYSGNSRWYDAEA